MRGLFGAKSFYKRLMACIAAGEKKAKLLISEYVKTRKIRFEAF